VKASDRAIILGVLVAALAIGFYLLVLGPKRDEASKLNKQIDDLHASILQQQQVADFAEQARKEFPRYYGRLVVLGKAVPAQADTASMLVQLSSIARDTKVKFRGIALNQGSASAGTGTSSTPAPATTPPPTGSTGTATTPSPPASSGTSTAGSSSTTASSSSTSSSATTGTSATPTAAPATEASAATLPIGAEVGPAGLPTLPYDLSFTGSFFDISNFIGGIDGLVTPHEQGTRVSSDGRLFTIDGFALKGGAPGSSPVLQADFLVTTYVTPEEQGLTAGASPSGPAAPTSPTAPQVQPASAVVSK
jgi:Tfp pilus assembly protein PilO